MKADEMFLHTFVATPVQILLLCSHFVIETVTTTQTETCISIVDGHCYSGCCLKCFSQLWQSTQPCWFAVIQCTHVHNHIMPIIMFSIMNTSLGVSGD